MRLKPSLIPLYFVNFLGVLNDNLLKSLICLLSVYWVSEGNEAIVIMLAAGLMVIPFILFSPIAGFIAKTINKRQAVVFLKTAEVFIMALASIGFWVENIYIVLTAMFLMGLQSTFFSPLKFTLVRDIGGAEKSSIGTGTIEMTTFLGVLIGTVFAGLLTDIQIKRFLWLIASFALIVSLGLINSLLIKAIEPKPLTIRIIPWNFLAFIKRKYRWSNTIAPGLNNVVFGLSMFWLIGSLVKLNLFVHCPITLGMSATETGVTIAFVAVAVALGSLLSGVASGKRVETGFILIGGICFIISLFMIYIFNPYGIFFKILISFSAFSAGFCKTPLNAWMQVNIKGRQLGDAIAYNNLINFIFILASALIFGYTETTFGSKVNFLLAGILASVMVVYLALRLKGIKESLMYIFSNFKIR